MSACTSTPISMLRLERFKLGESDDADKRAIEEHLASCEACTRTLATLDEPIEMPALPPRKAKPKSNVVLFRAAGAITGALAIAAAVVLVVGKKPVIEGDGPRVKGGDVSFALVRDDDTMFDEGGGTYRDGDRFKALATCAPGTLASLDVVVFDHDGASFPIAPQPGFSCGNRIALPGAFRVTGKDALTVCLTWSEEGPIDRARVKALGRTALHHAECKTLLPAAP